MYSLIDHKPRRPPRNKRNLIGQNAPLKPQQIWTIRSHLQLQDRTRDLALFNFAIDSKLRGCDLVALKVGDIAHGIVVQPHARIIQQKTMRPVQFEITERMGRGIGLNEMPAFIGIVAVVISLGLLTLSGAPWSQV